MASEVCCSIIKPRRDENLRALNILRASSLNLSSGFPVVLIILLLISHTPPKGSINPALGLKAMELIVKSRLLRSSLIYGVKHTLSGCL